MGVWGTWSIGHMGNGVQGQLGTEVWDTWAQGQ